MQMTEDEVAALIKKCKEEGKTEEKFVRASFHRPTSFRPRKHPALPPVYDSGDDFVDLT